MNILKGIKVQDQVYNVGIPVVELGDGEFTLMTNKRETVQVPSFLAEAAELCGFQDASKLLPNSGSSGEMHIIDKTSDSDSSEDTTIKVEVPFTNPGVYMLTGTDQFGNSVAQKLTIGETSVPIWGSSPSDYSIASRKMFILTAIENEGSYGFEYPVVFPLKEEQDGTLTFTYYGSN